MSDKCIVYGCENYKHEGYFIGDLCSPCHNMITSGKPNYGATFIHDLRDQVKELEAENQKLRKALDIYQRERDRFKHTHPEMTGAYFLTGGHGTKDENGVPMYVEICPAYGCGWTYVYQTTGRTISYEGS